MSRLPGQGMGRAGDEDHRGAAFVADQQSGREIARRRYLRCLGSSAELAAMAALMRAGEAQPFLPRLGKCWCVARSARVVRLAALDLRVDWSAMQTLAVKRGGGVRQMIEATGERAREPFCPSASARAP